MNKSIIYLITAVFSMGMFSCDGNNNTEKIDPEIEKNAAILASLKTSTEAEGNEYTMKGKFKLPRSPITVIKDNKTMMNFHVEEEEITINDINFAKEQPNAVWYPDEYGSEDVITYDKNNVEGSLQDTYLVTFKVKSLKVEEPPTIDPSGLSTKSYEKRKAKNELKIKDHLEMIEFEKVP